MEVIVKGNKFYNDPGCIFTCRYCGARIKARKSEGKYFASQKDGDHIEYKCPECSNKTYVPIEKHTIFE